jgi:branched-chain amino acid transport system permease protein
MMRKTLFVAVAVAVLALPWFMSEQGYLLRVICLILLFAAMSQTWNIAAGLSGQISLGHAGFFGAGAYTSTILLVNFGLSPWFGLLAAGVVGALLAALISAPTRKLKGHYFALATLAFGEAMRVIANSWSGLTGGPVGISVPFAPPEFAIMQFQSLRPYFYIMLGALVATCVIFHKIQTSALGLRLRALKNHPDAASSLGVNTASAKLAAATISGTLMAMMGVLYSQFQFFFDPDTVFSLAGISVRVALMAIIGGIGMVYGPIVGALLIIPIEETTNALLSAQGAGLSQVVFGTILIVIVILQPKGLLHLLKRGR